MDQTIKPKNNKIFVSVIMAVYNGEKFVQETIDSILNQTFSNFEYIIVDDASTDTTREIVASYTDPRIVYIRNDRNQGQTVSRNTAIARATGTYIIQTDADDISLPYRIQTQVDYMEKYSSLALCGSWVKSIGSGASHIIRHNTNPEEIKVLLLFRTAITHSTLIMRRNFLIEHNLAYKEFPDGKVYGEDYELYVRVSRIGTIGNIPEVLVLYRKHNTQVTQSNIETQYTHARDIIKNQLIFLSMDLTKTDPEIPLLVKKYLFLDDKNFLQKLEIFFSQLEQANKLKCVYEPKALSSVCGEIWLEVSTALSMKYDVWKKFWQSKPRHWITKTPRVWVKIVKMYYRHLLLSYSN